MHSGSQARVDGERPDAPTSGGGMLARRADDARAEEDARAIVALRPRVVSAKEAMRYLAIGETKLHELLNAGRIQAKKSGNRLLITVESLDAYIDSLPNAERLS
jgi:excisionase family DNA binding protein